MTVKKTGKNRSTAGQRLAVGLIAGLLLSLAVVLMVVNGLEAAAKNIAIGVSVRIGIVLMTIWLAWPTMENLSFKAPPVVIYIMLGAMVSFVIRPKLLVVFMPVAVIALVLHFGLRFFSQNLR